MTDSELFELMDRFERSSLQTLKLSRPGFSLELGRGAAGTAAIPAAPAAPAAASAPAKEDAADRTVDAPLVGTFYAAPAPDQPPFITPGARVSKGQTLCLIEAMKMMNEVLAPCDCVIDAVLKTDGELVAFGDPLLRYTPC